MEPLADAIPRTQGAAFLDGGGELGALMRAHDWSKTPLGPAASWPLSLKTAVRIMLTSRQPFWLGWGPELTYLYNDPYKSIIGGKHPQALGRPFCEVWREIFDVVGPMAERVMTRDEGTYVESQLLIMERHGYPEETYYTFSYSPVPNDEGGPGGLICANTDDTQRVIGERQLMLLRELAARTANARTVSDACELAMQALSTNPRDVPFALIYLVRDGDEAPVLTASSAGPSPLAGADRWPLASAIATMQIQEVAIDPAAGNIPSGAWQRPPHKAVVLPFALQGAAGQAGALVVGLNPFRQLDAGYRGFLELAAGQVAAAIANAQAYEDEKRRAEALAELDRAKTAFFSNVSHEFRTPLALMLGPLDDILARPGAEVAPEARASLRVVNRNAQRLLKLVNTLLDFARIEAGREHAAFEPTNLGALTVELASNFRSACERAGIRLEVHAPGDAEPAYVDREMWEKIVFNLLSNAFKFTLQGTIGVRLDLGGDAFTLTVQDTGSGIPPEALPRMFERFHRVEGTSGRSHEGSGIGLALVQELVRLHGGTIGVTSTLGEGSTFTVRLPRGRDHLPADQVKAAGNASHSGVRAGTYVDEALSWLPASEAPQSHAPPAGPAKRIILADDNADLREYARRLLAEHYEVEAVADGVEALAAARAHAPDLVVTDVMMPRLDGFGLIRELREDPVLRTLPVVVLSARAGDEARIEGLARGADDYLVKPFSSRELLVRVGALLRAQDLRREAQRAIAESEAKFRTLAEAAPAFIWLTDAAGEPGYVNPRFVDILGKDAGDMGAGRWHSLIHPADREAYVGGFEAAVRSRETFHARARVKARDGQWVWLESHARPLFGDSGRFLGHVGISPEITATVEHEEALREADRRKDEFIATLSHELRNPLAPLRNALYLLRSSEGNGQASARVHEMMERQVNHLVRLVDDLLEMSRISRGKLELRRERVELASVMRNALETSGPVVEEGRHELVVRLPAKPVWLDGDPVRLAQIISNLINNAAKYTQNEGRIEVGATAGESGVAIYVRDNGPGIDPAELPRMFEMFTRGDPVSGRGQSGLGIGLALARRLAQMHGGTLDAVSEGAGKGAEFTLRLPLGAQAPDPGREPPAPPAVGALRVLVVDDNRDAADSLAMILASLGTDAHVAHDGAEALQRYESLDPDVVLLDIGMPAMDGYEVCRSMRTRFPDRATPVVALTGWGQDEDRRRARMAGFDHHLVKPVEIPVLRELLASLKARADSA